MMALALGFVLGAIMPLSSQPSHEDGLSSFGYLWFPFPLIASGTAESAIGQFVKVGASSLRKLVEAHHLDGSLAGTIQRLHPAHTHRRSTKLRSQPEASGSDAFLLL